MRAARVSIGLQEFFVEFHIGGENQIMEMLTDPFKARNRWIRQIGCYSMRITPYLALTELNVKLDSVTLKIVMRRV